MNGVMIIPTGLGCAIGGNAGDGNPAARLMASVCDRLIVHPNVVNAADINEMTENMLYVEGSMLDSFLAGEFNLKEVYGNRILVVVNKPVPNEAINAVSASKATLGITVEILELTTPLTMRGYFDSANALVSEYTGCDELIDQLLQVYDEFDALAIHTPIDVNDQTALRYFREGGVNPWGAVEAKVSKQVARALNKPVAHGPVENERLDQDLVNIITNEVVNPTVAPEVISYCYLHSVLKGLHRAPRPVFDYGGYNLSVSDIDFMVSPWECWGPPHQACEEAGIPIIFVENNKPIVDPIVPDYQYSHLVANYMEAAGLVSAMKAGVNPDLISRPLEPPKIR